MASATFFTTDLDQLVQQLDASTQPKWGIMTAQHMIEHLGSTFLFSIQNKVEAKKTAEEYKMMKMGTIHNDEWIFPKSVRIEVVPEKPKPYRFESMEIAKAKLEESRAKFFGFYEANPTHEANHPVFGPLGMEEWKAFHVKHIIHHFTQFGLIAER